jgi:hypothetical protein
LFFGFVLRGGMAFFGFGVGVGIVRVIEKKASIAGFFERSGVLACFVGSNFSEAIFSFQICGLCIACEVVCSVL